MSREPSGYGTAVGRLVRPYREGTDLVTVSASEWDELSEAIHEIPDLQDALANERAYIKALEKRRAAERERVADYLLTYSGDGDTSDPWQAGHNYAMREASRMVREGWTDQGSALTDPIGGAS